MSRRKTTRRVFMKGTALSGAGIWLAGNAGCADSKVAGKPGLTQAHKAKGTYKANEKLNIAGVGVGGKGSSDIMKCASENVVALCDVDWGRGAGAIMRFRKAKKYHDYRVMFDEMHKGIDAITCSTPDHMHAPISIHAMRLGKHVYCQKPLTHDVYEARMMAQVAKEHNVATQMGNQGTAHNGFRTAVETIRSGVIGNITEAHVWTNRPVWPQGMARPKGSHPIPMDLRWNLFLGTAPTRPFLKTFPDGKFKGKGIYHPFAWRGWWDFGTGALGDMGCHTANMAYMALGLGSPTRASAECSGFEKDSFPTWSIIEIDFPARGSKPPIKWTWYDGGSDKPAKVNKKLKSMIHGERVSGSGSILIGDKGTLYSPNDYGASFVLLPKKDFEGWKAPDKTFERWRGGDIDMSQRKEWIRACKDPKKPALSNFAYAGALTETLLLGNIAMYTGKTILFDGKKCEITNCPEGQALIRRQYRKGWDQI